MEQKLNKVVEWFDEERRQVLFGLIMVIFLIALEVLGVIIALKMNNYFLLSFVTYIWVWIITECFLKKYLLKRLDSLLLKTSILSKLIFFLVSVTSIAFSYKYFGAFIFSCILAFMYGEFCRMEEEDK